MAELEGESDETLLARHARGEPGAFDVLYARRKSSVEKFVKSRLHGYPPYVAQEVQSVVVDTWSEVSGSAGSFRGESAVLTWICGIATHWLNRRIRDTRYSKEKQAAQDDEGNQPQLEGIRDRDRGVVAQVELRGFRQDLDEALPKLTPDQALVFALRREDREWSEIAAIMRVDESTARYHFRQALLQLGRLLPGHAPERRQQESEGAHDAR
jgi:RNA polymerase sigma-70 factor (ECF subfamily)